MLVRLVIVSTYHISSSIVNLGQDSYRKLMEGGRKHWPLQLLQPALDESSSVPPTKQTGEKWDKEVEVEIRVSILQPRPSVAIPGQSVEQPRHSMYWSTLWEKESVNFFLFWLLCSAKWMYMISFIRFHNSLPFVIRSVMDNFVCPVISWRAWQDSNIVKYEKNAINFYAHYFVCTYFTCVYLSNLLLLCV